MGLKYSKRDQQPISLEPTEIVNTDNTRIVETGSEIETTSQNETSEEKFLNIKGDSFDRCDMASFTSYEDSFDDYERNIISTTYKLIKDNLNNVGVIAFMKSFESQPDLKDHFDALKSLPVDELSKSHALRTHSKKVMNIIDEFVYALENGEMEPIICKLFELGERHQIYGAKKKFFMVIEVQFISAIRPIMMKNLRSPSAAKIFNENGTYIIQFIDRSEDENKSNSNDEEKEQLSDEEVKKAMEIIERQWHKVFERIRYHMSLGADYYLENRTR